jgi:group I intron endonuclease
LEYIDISDLSKEDTRNLILSREQHYIDCLVPEYNILKVAGSSLGFTHSTETIAKMSLDRSGDNHPMFGFIHSDKTKAAMSEIHKGKTHTADTKAKMSLAKIGENHPMKKNVFLYSFDEQAKETRLYKSFNTCIEAAKYLDTSRRTISRYLDKKKLFREQWILLSSLIIKE